jgi:tRNA 2-thiouridine synthesizing protein C|tara:strand:- start:5928 stop:6299 length:372 start_codon:yes stop_codon:yes gene_type:complete
MTTQDKKRMLVVIRHSPYGSSLAKASLDVVLAAAAFDQNIALLFLGDGVLQLIPRQESSALGKKNIGRQLASLPLYDIDSVYVDAEAAARYNIDLTTSPVDTQSISTGEIHQLMTEFDHILSF